MKVFARGLRMSGTVFAIRAHEPSRAVVELHAVLAREFPGERLVVVVDELHGAARRNWPAAYELVPVDDALLESLGLRTDIADAGWRCGDFAYYALASALDFEHAWLIEPDVGFHGLDVRGLFMRFAASTADLIAADVRPAPSWLWSFQLTARGVDAPWRCFFPMTRMSRAAIESALGLRRRIQWIDGGNYGHPNDEGIVASAVAADELTWEDLRKADPEIFAHFHHRPKLQGVVVAERFGRAFVVHPDLEPDEFNHDLRRALLRAGRQDIKKALPVRARPPAVATIEALGDFGLLTETQRAEHQSIFGPPDAQSPGYDSEFRREVVRTLPAPTRAIIAAVGVLVRCCGTPVSRRGVAAVTAGAGDLSQGEVGDGQRS